MIVHPRSWSLFPDFTKVPKTWTAVPSVWIGTVRGTDFWYEILFGTVRGTDFGQDFLLVRYVVSGKNREKHKISRTAPRYLEMNQ